MNQPLATHNGARRKMVRKQVYLLAQQESKLKERAQRQSVTEAELIRQAVDAFLDQQPQNGGDHLPPDEAAWQEILASFEMVRSRSAVGDPQRWTRDNYYDDPRYERPWAQ